MVEFEKLIPTHGGYRRLKSFQIAQLVYDITVRFVERYVDRFSRSRDQMVQAARSGVQNIAEGSQASGTSKKTELKLTNVARASLEELRLDYEDYLRQKGLPLWHTADPRRKELISIRAKTADQVAMWVMQVHKRQASIKSIPSIKSEDSYAEITCNAVLVLIGVAGAMLDRQLAAQAKAFETEGGFTERLYRVRTQKRGN
jgi:four helix bundle suffix protein